MTKRYSYPKQHSWTCCMTGGTAQQQNLLCQLYEPLAAYPTGNNTKYSPQAATLMAPTWRLKDVSFRHSTALNGVTNDVRVKHTASLPKRVRRRNILNVRRVWRWRYSRQAHTQQQYHSWAANGRSMSHENTSLFTQPEGSFTILNWITIHCLSFSYYCSFSKSRRQRLKSTTQS